MEFHETELLGVFLVHYKKFPDSRGYFLESYKKAAFESNGLHYDFIQDNLSCSKRNVLRGLHFQKDPFAQTKFVRCIQGSIFDVAVDLRIGSPTFGKWVGYELNDENCSALLIPGGFAHGFYVLSDQAFVSYKIDAPYNAASEGSIIFNDKDVDIKWPGSEFIVSDKDQMAPSLKDFQSLALLISTS